MQNSEKNCQCSNRSNEQEQFEKPEHKLEICTEFLPTHGYHLKKILIRNLTRAAHFEELKEDSNQMHTQHIHVFQSYQGNKIHL
jgi:hypothetical protein